MRSGLAFRVSHGDGHVTLGFENSAVYQDAMDAFDAAQRSIVATMPGAVFRYINSGLNVLGAIVRDQIERRGLPYCETLYGLLVDRLGVASYQHSADIAGNLIASGASDQRIFISRRHRLTVAVSNETDHPMDLLALDQVIAAASVVPTKSVRYRARPGRTTSGTAPASIGWRQTAV